MARSPERARILAGLAAAGIVLGAASCKRDERETPSQEPAAASASANMPARTASPAPSASGERAEARGSEKDCCMGKNPCRGKGGCAVPESHACKGQNACAGQGGCRVYCPR